MAGLADLFGEGSVARQFLIYGVGYEIARAIVGPVFRALEQNVNERDPNDILSPAALADLVVKGWMTQADGEKEAAKAGLDKDRFTAMVNGTGEPIPLMMALEFWRRGFMPFDASHPGEISVETAIRQSHMRDDWLNVIHQGHLQPPSAAAAVNAVLRNQISEDEGLAMAWYAGLGVHNLAPPDDPALADTKRAFDILVNSSGIPPAPGELLTLVRRGVIPWGDLDPATKTPNPAELSFAQGIFEGDLKDKWMPALSNLYEAIPSPYYILESLKAGGIDQKTAADLFAKDGYPEAVINGFLSGAAQAKVAKQKNLTVSNIETLYAAQALSSDQATSMLTTLGYTADEAGFILELKDFDRALATLNSTVNKLKTLYVARKITATEATNALNSLGIPSGQVTVLFNDWDLERTNNLKILTEAQIAGAFKYGILAQDDAINRLVAIGYSEFDAWVVLSVEVKGPIPDQPPET